MRFQDYLRQYLRKKEAVQEGAAGHGCGHNLLGAASAVAAIAVKRFLEQENQEGTIRFYGCPEEELLSGKSENVLSSYV